MNCTRCRGTGFLNLDQIPDRDMSLLGAAEVWHLAVLGWIEDANRALAASGGCSCHINPPCSYCLSLHDVSVCDCCGNGEDWHGTPGEHNNFRGPNAAEPFPECY